MRFPVDFVNVTLANKRPSGRFFLFISTNRYTINRSDWAGSDRTLLDTNAACLLTLSSNIKTRALGQHRNRA